jgi:phosphate starvation-inducible protein PhoH
MKQLEESLSSVRLNTVGYVETGSTSFDVDIEMEADDAVGSLIGSGGVVANLFRRSTGLTMKMDGNNLKLTGKQSNTLTEAHLRLLLLSYLSYRTEVHSILPIISITDSMNPKTINSQLMRKEAMAGIVPIKIGSGVSRSYKQLPRC